MRPTEISAAFVAARTRSTAKLNVRFAVNGLYACTEVRAARNRRKNLVLSFGIMVRDRWLNHIDAFKLVSIGWPAASSRTSAFFRLRLETHGICRGLNIRGAPANNPRKTNA